MLRMTGGVVGIAVGVGTSYAITACAAWNTSVSSVAVVPAVCVSAAVSLAFGIYPASQEAG